MIKSEKDTIGKRIQSTGRTIKPTSAKIPLVAKPENSSVSFSKVTFHLGDSVETLPDQNQILFTGESSNQGVTRRRRLSLLTNSAPRL